MNRIGYIGLTVLVEFHHVDRISPYGFLRLYRYHSNVLLLTVGFPIYDTQARIGFVARMAFLLEILAVMY